MEKESALKKVVGLKYEIGEGLPQVIVKGSGRLAEAIMKRRDALNGPMVVKNEKLATELFKLPVDAAIGPELFELVAILLVHVYSVEEKLKQDKLPG